MIPRVTDRPTARLLVNEQEIAGAVGSAALQQQHRRRGAAGLWHSLERRGRMHLLLCADLVRFYREEAEAEAAAEAAAAREDDESRDGDGGYSSGGGSSRGPSQLDGGGGGAGGKRKPSTYPAATSQGSGSSSAAGGRAGGARKRSRATDPWEDILGALNPQELLGGRSSSISGSGSGR